MQILTQARFQTAVLCALILAITGASATAQDMPGADAQDHAALAQSYRAQAADFRSQASKHQKSAQMHRRMSGKAESAHNAMARHCDKIARQLTLAAGESDKLAELHEQLLRDAKAGG